jgi:alpha-L-rhamnosidase
MFMKISPDNTNLMSMKRHAMFILVGILACAKADFRQRSCRAAQAADGTMVVRELSCEYAQNPLGVDAPEPRFSWILESRRRGQMQSAYHILVATSIEKLTDNIGDKWDSREKFSDESVNISYAGQTLKSGERCYWKVRVWDKEGKSSPWSELAWFEMGLLEENDWRGEWIGTSSRVNYIERESLAGGEQENLALDLSGINVDVHIPHHKLFKPDQAMSLCAWIKPANYTSDWQCIIRKSDGGKGRWLLAVGGEKPMQGLHCGFVINGKYHEKSAAVDPSILTDGNWHLAVATYDGSQIRIYFDDKKARSWAVTGLLSIAGTGDVYIGSYGGKKEFFDGAIDDVRIYRSALSDEDISNLYKRESEPDTSPAGRWKFNGDLRDSSGHENHAQTGNASAGFSPLLRKEFSIDKPISQARAYISGLGWCELYINGQKVSNRVLDPATTDYDKRIFYVTHDVTDCLRQGDNAIGVMLGNGWFCPAYCSSCRLLFQMHIQFADSTSLVIKSDKSWKTSEGPIGHNSIIRGEIYDARKEKPGYDDSGWTSVSIQPSPGGFMTSQLLPPIKVNENLSAISLHRPAAGTFIYDFGRLYAGWARFRFQGEAGRQITIKYAPLLKEDGYLKEIPGGRSRDIYILKGDSEGEVYEPRFTFHPVRYVQIENYPGKLAASDVVGRMAYNAVDMTGGFTCSNDLLNRIHANVHQTVKNELYGIQMDCINAEYWGWLEPGSTPGTLYPRIYMPLFWQKYLDDAKYAQNSDGVIPDVIPKYPVKNRHTGDPAWVGNYPIAAWYVYQYYNDKRILEEHYPGMKLWLKNLIARADGFILKYGYYGDHMLPGAAPGREEWMSSETPKPLIKTAFFYNNTRLTAQVAKILGHDEEAAKYFELAHNINQAFHETWFQPFANQYAAGSQTSNLLPLVFGMTSEAHKKAVAKNIVENITVKYNGHHHTGNIGTTALMEALTKYGYGEVMYNMVNRVDYPGWGYMIDQGATTIWESWGARSTNDDRLSMAMFTTIDHFFYNDLAGIKGPAYFSTEVVTPGFKQIIIQPLVPKGLNYAKAWHKTVRGTVFSHWCKREDTFTLEVVIPVNSIAKVGVPKMGFKDIAITENNILIWNKNKFLNGVEGIYAADETDDYVIFETGSGSYCFQLRKTK